MLRTTRIVAWGVTSIVWTAPAFAQISPEEPPPRGAAAPPAEADSPRREEGSGASASEAEGEAESGQGEDDTAPDARDRQVPDEVIVVEPAQSEAEAKVALEDARAAVARAEIALERAREAEESGEELAPEDAAAVVDAEALLIVWHGLAGKGIVARITALEDFVRDHPKSRYAVVMYEEAAALRDLVERRAETPKSPAPTKNHHSLYQTNLSAPAIAPAGRAFDVVVELNRAPDGEVRLLLQRGWNDFEPHPMRSIGKLHYAFRVPASEVTSPGVDFVIEVDDGDGAPKALVGRKASPHTVEVKTGLEEKAASEPVVEAWAKGEYVDVNHFNGDDYLLRAWGAGSVRFGDLGLRRVSLGYTFTHAITGGHDWLDHGPGIPYTANFGAGFVELEFAPDEFVSLVARPIIGRQGDDAAGGFRGGLRVGHDLGTNLLLACEGVVGWGMLGVAQVEIQEVELVPITLRLEATNQGSAAAPFGEISSGLWGRGIVEVGYRVHPSFEFSGRVSVQGRAEEHAGVGIGGGARVRW